MSRKSILFLALAAALIAVAVAGCTNPSPAVKTGDNVTIDYIINASNGTMLQTSFAQLARDLGVYDPEISYSPYRFKVGDPMVIEGVSEAVVGMKVNETKTVEVPPEKAYGLYNRSLIVPVSLSELIAANITPYVNMSITTLFGTARVDSIDTANDTLYLDFNKPYAGQTLIYQVTVRKIE